MILGHEVIKLLKKEMIKMNLQNGKRLRNLENELMFAERVG